MTKLEEIHRSFPTYAISAEEWNLVCWNGSRSNLDVLFACDAAVMLEPEIYYYRDARGVALARKKGLKNEAIREFQVFLSVTGYSEYAESRTKVIEELKKENWVFDPDFLKRHFAEED